MGSLRLGVLASGRGSDLQSILDAQDARLLDSRVVVVVSDVPGAKALERARSKGIPALAVEVPKDVPAVERRERHDAKILQVLKEHKVDLVVLAGYMRILTKGFVAAYAHRIVNVHPALLPSFPGVRGQKQALDWGVRVTGCTTHFVDPEVDHGPILLQAAVPIPTGHTEEDLSRKILQVEHQILPRTIRLIESGAVRVEGRRVRIEATDSWKTRLPVLPDVLYGPGY